MHLKRELSMVFACAVILLDQPLAWAKSPTVRRSFIREVRQGLPHKIPKEYSDGVWISSVPIGLHALVFPADFSGPMYEYVGKISKGRPARPYYVGRTPVYVKLVRGRYQVVIFHPPLEEVDKTYKQEWESEDDGAPSGFRITKPKNPFIGPNTLIAVEGRYFWAVEQLVDVDAKLETVIGLFQRRDKRFTYLLQLLPPESNFEFTMIDNLRHFPHPPGYPPGGIPERDIEKALQVLRRGGVLGWEIDAKHRIVFEITGPNNTYNVHY